MGFSSVRMKLVKFNSEYSICMNKGLVQQIEVVRLVGNNVVSFHEDQWGLCKIDSHCKILS